MQRSFVGYCHFSVELMILGWGIHRVMLTNRGLTADWKLMDGMRIGI